MRAIPNAKSYYNADAPQLRILPLNFQPDERRDPDGISLYRLRFVTAEEVAKQNKHPKGCWIARLPVRAVFRLNIEIVPSPDPSGLPGHVIIPQMSYDAYKNKRDFVNETQLAMARLAIIVYGPTPAIAK